MQRISRALVSLRARPSRPYALNNTTATTADFIGYEVLGCMQEPNLDPTLAHIRYRGDDTSVFTAFLPKRRAYSAESMLADGVCSAYIQFSHQGCVTEVGIEQSAFPADYPDVPLVNLQQLVLVLFQHAAKTVPSNEVLSFAVSRADASQHGPFGLLLPAGGMHRHGSCVLGRPQNIIASCSKTLAEELRGDGTTVCTANDFVWNA